MTKKELIDNLVENVGALWRKDVVDFYEVNQAQHIRWEFEGSGELSDNYAAFVRTRATNEVGRHPAALVRVYREFREKWDRLETKEKEQQQ